MSSIVCSMDHHFETNSLIGQVCDARNLLASAPERPPLCQCVPGQDALQGWPSLAEVESLSDLSPRFVETATRTANRTSSDSIALSPASSKISTWRPLSRGLQDVREFFIWYSAFSFSEELTPNKAGTGGCASMAAADN